MKQGLKLKRQVTATSAAKARIVGKSSAELLAATRVQVGTITQTGLPKPKKGDVAGDKMLDAFRRAKANVVERSRAQRAKTLGRLITSGDEFATAGASEVRRGIEAGIEDLLVKFEAVLEARHRLREQGNPLEIIGRRYDPPPSAVTPTPERLAKGQNVVWKEIDGRKRKYFETTVDNLERFKHIPREFRDSVNFLAFSLAAARGVAVDDRDHSTARLVSRYDGVPGGSAGPRDIPQCVLDAQRRVVLLWRRIPPELRPVLGQILEEQLGDVSHREPLIQFGEKLNYKDKEQARAAGSALAYSALSILHHAIKDGHGQIENDGHPRNTLEKARA